MAVSKALRYEILRRDNHTCRYCGGHAPDVVLTIDHVVPTTLGGGDEPANLVTACADCNSGKRATPPGAPLVDDVAQDALRWAAAIKQATDNAMAEREVLVAAGKRVWDVFDGLHDYLPGDWSVTVDRFVAAGLHPEEVFDAALIAITAKHIPGRSLWRYFCGVCSNKIRDRRDQAAALVGAQQPPPLDPHPCKLGDLCPAHDRDGHCPWCGSSTCAFWCAWGNAMQLGRAMFRNDLYRIAADDLEAVTIDA